MYVKLALRSARRSAKDYGLYLATVLVLALLIHFSNLIAALSEGLGAQADSLPLMICLIMASLLHYINGFILRRRSRELATYLLLGMGRNSLACVFFLESALLGTICFLAGALLGSAVFCVAFRTVFTADSAFHLAAGLRSFLYFLVAEAFSLLGNSIRIRKLQISRLMAEGRRNEPATKKPKPVGYTILLCVCFLMFLFQINLITQRTDALAMIAVSTVSISLLLTIWAFYKAVYLWLEWVRIRRRSLLYSGGRLYLAANMLSKCSSGVRLNAVLSVCLLFSAICFVTSAVMRSVPEAVFENSQWMAFLQLCLSVTFLSVYFSVLGVRQAVDVREGRFGLRIMGHLGSGKRQLTLLLFQETGLRFSMPACACILLLGGCAFPLNAFLNSVLPYQDVLFGAAAGFVGCFLVLYLLYFCVVCRLSARLLDT